MTIWLVHSDEQGEKKRLNLDLSPCPTIMAGGVYGDNTSHYYLMEDNELDKKQKNTKPPYRVPSMVEIAAIPHNGFFVVSTFSGCGGSSLGYKMAGFKVLWANEFVPAARDTYRANFPEAILDARDIRTIRPQEILDAIGMQPGQLDLLDGSPPCAAFSTAGQREAGWGKVKNYSDTKQRVDDLFFEYARLVKGIQPKVFVAENVSGLVKGVAKGYFLEVLAALKDCGYNVKAKLLDAQWLGVPQMRQRVIFIGVRQDLGLEPSFPKPLSYRYSVRDALPWIEKQAVANDTFEDAERAPARTVQAGTGRRTSSTLSNESLGMVEATPRAYRDRRGAFGNEGDISDQPAPTVLADAVGTHWIVGVSTYKGDRSPDKPAPSVMTYGRQRTTSELMLVEAESDISRFAIGQEWDKLKQGEQSEKYFQMVKADVASPWDTVTQRGGDNTVASVTHPTEKRKFSIAELRRICAFPDDFILTGTYSQQWERLGRAVPPVMMRHIAETIRDNILCQLKS